MNLSQHFDTSQLEFYYSNVFDVNFGHEILNISCFKITEDSFFFNFLYKKDNNMLYLIDNLINSNKYFDVFITLYNKIGEELTIILLENVNLLTIKDLLNFDYSSEDIVKITVDYKYQKMKIFNDRNELKNYDRKRKLEKINKN